jgi:DNA polymerase elongation subunit (family B)
MASDKERPLNIAERAAINLHCILFLDVETVPGHQNFEELSEDFQQLWRDKSRRYSSEGKTPEELYFDKAGIHAEFGKIICISVGYFPEPKTLKEGEKSLRITSFYSDNEADLLLKFKMLLDKSYADCNRHTLCAHNGIEFDFPYIARRMMINDIRLPNLLNVSGTKSWNNPFLLDTMEMWKFGDYKASTSLSLLSALFGIPTSKDDISGKDVANVYYEGNGLERIKTYCEKDVLNLARIYRKFASLGPIAEGDVMFL